MIFYTEYTSPLGTMQLAATGNGICGVYFENHRHFKGIDGWQPDPENPRLQQAARQLEEYFSGQRSVFDLALDTVGTPFQRAVWDGLCGIPYARTATYTKLAQAIGNPAAVRAVAAANGRNPVSIIVPCHRVIGMSGDLVGYAGGLERKRYLLALEARQHS